MDAVQHPVDGNWYKILNVGRYAESCGMKPWHDAATFATAAGMRKQREQAPAVGHRFVDAPSKAIIPKRFREKEGIREHTEYTWVCHYCIDQLVCMCRVSSGYFVSRVLCFLIVQLLIGDSFCCRIVRRFLLRS